MPPTDRLALRFRCRRGDGTVAVMYRVVIADAIGVEGREILETASDFEVVTPQGDMSSALADADGLLVRSATKVTAELLAAAPKLRVVGRAGIGTDNIDVAAATHAGVIVMNTPQANSLATAEQTFALMLAASRHTAQAHASMIRGEWERSQFSGVELGGKKIGIIGFGRIGRLVAERARAFGMEVLAYDPYVSELVARAEEVTLLDLDGLLAQSDYLTVHAPRSAETENMIDEQAIAGMKDGVIIVNAARGGLIDESALADALRSGKVRAAGIDVYAKEPPSESPLVGLPNVVHTPHLGASTAEAQRDVASQIAEQMIDALRGDDIRNAINLPFGAGPRFREAMPYMALADKMGALQFHLARGPVRRVELEVQGDMVEELARPIAAALLAGLLREHLAEGVNYVNAPVLAQQHGVAISEARGLASRDYANLVSCRVHWDEGSRDMAGVLFGGGEPRIVLVDDYHLDVQPTGRLLILLNKDVPGVIGTVGTTLGRFGVNIGEWRMGRAEPGTDALSFINIDNEPPSEALEALRAEAAVVTLLSLQL